MTMTVETRCPPNRVNSTTALLAELVRREVLGVRADPLSPQRGHYGFVQTMFRQVAYDTLSRRERKARHLAVANHLRSVFADQGEEITEVIATHLLDALAAVPDDPDTPQLRDEAVAMLTRAGERAERTGAPTTAATNYQKAAELLEEHAADDSQLKAAGLWERAGKAAELTDLDAAILKYQKAADLYQPHDHARAGARCLTGIGRSLRYLGQHEEARNRLQDALTVLQPEPDVDTVEALASLASLEIFAGNLTDGDRLSSAALTAAQAIGLSDAVLADLFVTRGLLHIFADRTAQAGMYYREAIRRGDASSSAVPTVRARINLAEVLLSSDSTSAVETARQAVEEGRRLGHQTYLRLAINNLLQALLLAGEWDEFVATYDDAVAEDRLEDDPTLICISALLRTFRGDRFGLQETRPVFLAWADTEDPTDLAQLALVSALFASMQGNAAEALAQAERAISYTDAVGLSAEPLRWGWTLAADVALALGDHAKAADLLGWLDQHPPGHIPALTRAEAKRIRARLLAVKDDAAAPDEFDAAIQALRQVGSPYHLAVGLLDQAEYLGRQKDHPEAATQLAEEAVTIAQRLRAAPLLQRATAFSATDSDASQLPAFTVLAEPL